THARAGAVHTRQARAVAPDGGCRLIRLCGPAPHRAGPSAFSYNESHRCRKAARVPRAVLPPRQTSMSKTTLGANMLARSIRQAGVTQIFSLSGNHIMPVYDAIIDEDLPLLHTRHEGAAVHMADAWARLTGQVGVALVTGGPGHANAVSALYTAYMSESPMVLLSGHAPLSQAGWGAFQEMDQ